MSKTTTSFLALAFLFVARLAGAADAPAAAPAPFPEDFKTHPCAAQDACATSWDPSTLADAGFRTIGATLDPNWIQRHHEEVLADVKTICPRLASCYAVPGNSYMFCDDLAVQEVRPRCDRYKDSKEDFEQCRWLVEVIMLSIDAKGIQSWRKAQDCSSKMSVPFKSDEPPVVWSVPATIPAGYEGSVTFFALDALTHLPLLASITIEGQKLYSPSNPAGSTATGYPFKWKQPKMIRVARADGHEDAVLPTITVEAPGYPAVTMKMPYEVPKLVLSVSPDPSKLRPGHNKITFKATDATTGKPVDVRLQLGDMVIGDSNNGPIEFDYPADRKGSELWAWALSRNYSDVVLVPGKR